MSVNKNKYSMKVWNKIKKLYVEDSLSAMEIANMSDSHPSHQAITYKAKRKDSATGLTWVQERDQRRVDHYNSIAPQAQVSLALNKINQLLIKKRLDTKDFDALSKMQKFLREITDWRYHAPMILQALEKYMKFVDKNYPEMITGISIDKSNLDKDVVLELDKILSKRSVITANLFLNSLTHFKNNLIAELEDVEYKGIASS